MGAPEGIDKGYVIDKEGGRPVLEALRSGVLERIEVALAALDDQQFVGAVNKLKVWAEANVITFEKAAMVVNSETVRTRAEALGILEQIQASVVKDATPKVTTPVTAPKREMVKPVVEPKRPANTSSTPSQPNRFADKARDAARRAGNFVSNRLGGRDRNADNPAGKRQEGDGGRIIQPTAPRIEIPGRAAVSTVAAPKTRANTSPKTHSVEPR